MAKIIGESCEREHFTKNRAMPMSDSQLEISDCIIKILNYVILVLSIPNF